MKEVYKIKKLTIIGEKQSTQSDLGSKIAQRKASKVENYSKLLDCIPWGFYLFIIL